MFYCKVKLKKNRFAIRIFSVIFILLLIVIGTSCLRRYNLTDEDLEVFYKVKNYKPRFSSYKISGRTIHYATVGNDSMPLILFIHGAPGAWFGYMPLLDDSLLQQNFKMISVDRPGYGKSDFGNSEPHIDIQASLLQPIIDSVPENIPILIVGRSFGAPIAAQLAARNACRIYGLILLGPAIDPDKEKFTGLASLARAPVIRWIIPTTVLVAAEEKKIHAAELKKMLPVWQKIIVPTTVFHGENDIIVDTANLSFARKMLKNTRSKIYLVPETGHLVSNERPDLVKREIFSYLGKN